MTFKKGQLVQSVKYGDYYVVIQVLHDGDVLTEPLTKKRLDKLYFTPDRLRLVGNKYTPKEVRK